MNPPQKNESTPSGQFPLTANTDLFNAQSEESTRYFESIERLCERYRGPILGWLLRKGNSPEMAEDLTQDFIHKFFRAEKLRQYRRTNVRFRSFLCRCLTNFSRDQWRKDRKAPENNGISTDDDDNPFDLSSPDATSDSEFDRSLAVDIHLQAIKSVAEEHYAKEGMRARFEALKHLITGESGETYEALAGRLGMTEANVKVTVHRMRDQWLRAFTGQVAEFTALEELAAELKYLIRLLAKERSG